MLTDIIIPHGGHVAVYYSTLYGIIGNSPIHGAAILPAEAWCHLSVPAWTIDLELRAAGIAAGSLTPPSCTPQNHSVPLITRCLNLPQVTSQCNVARDWVRYAPFCFWCASRGRKLRKNRWTRLHRQWITFQCPLPPVITAKNRWRSKRSHFTSGEYLRHNVGRK